MFGFGGSKRRDAEAKCRTFQTIIKIEMDMGDRAAREIQQMMTADRRRLTSGGAHLLGFRLESVARDIEKERIPPEMDVLSPGASRRMHVALEAYCRAARDCAAAVDAAEKKDLGEFGRLWDRGMAGFREAVRLLDAV